MASGPSAVDIGSTRGASLTSAAARAAPSGARGSTCSSAPGTTGSWSAARAIYTRFAGHAASAFGATHTRALASTG